MIADKVDSQPMYVSVRRAAEILGKSKWSVNWLISNGRLPAKRMGGQWRVPTARLGVTARKETDVAVQPGP